MTATRLPDDPQGGVMVAHTDVTQRKRIEDVGRRFVGTMDAITDEIYLIDRSSMCFLHVNDTACRSYQQTREELLARRPWELGFTSREELERTYDAIIASGGSAEPVEVLRPRPNGTPSWIEVRRHALFSEERWSIVTVVRDVTERRAAGERIRRLNRVYAVLSGINALIVRVRGREELFTEACRIAVDDGGFRIALMGIADRSATKITPVAMAGKDEEVLAAITGIMSLTEGMPVAMIAEALAGGKPVVSNDSQSDPKVALADRHAEIGIHSMAILPLIVADQAVGVLALYASEREFFHLDELKLLTQLAGDIAFAIDHIDKQERLHYLAYYDELTGLANRSLFLERVAQHIRAVDGGGRKLALFLVDLERFRNVNDSLGRPAGDALLRQVAQWLTRSARDASLVARVGADLFAVVLPEMKRDSSVHAILERTMEAFLDYPFHLHDPFQLHDAVFRIGAKVGIAVYPDDGAEADTLLKNAEAALKKAKASGDRFLFYAQQMTETTAGRLSLENRLRQALEKDEFVLYYQPKLNIASGRMTGAEALIRWNDPRSGLVLPDRFIPILEDTGMIREVGRWVMRKAIEDYLRWRAAGLPAVPISVNVSPLQLRDHGFVDGIRRKIGIDPHAAAGLELELTESLIMEDIKHSVATLEAVRGMGVGVAIDDFGTGFSSLGYLSRLPVDTLKIDRSFVHDMTIRPEGLALVSTIIELTHSLKLKVVAEGVETQEQLRQLKLLKCDEMQGFLIDQAVPGEIFETKYLAQPVLAMLAG
jgi:diguanylate cyclase (GGDEF)-like protein/PAS domain S-box-containing protein